MSVTVSSIRVTAYNVTSLFTNTLSLSSPLLSVAGSYVLQFRRRLFLSCFHKCLNQLLVLIRKIEPTSPR